MQPNPEHSGGSDSDSNSEELLEHYQPISVVDDEDSDQVNSDEDHEHILTSSFHSLPNGYICGTEHGVSRLDLNARSEHEGGEEDNSEEEEETIGEAPDMAILRAFREDESRRNAPLAPENASRVREAMRGVSLPGWTPEWAHQIPENQWIDELRRLREPPSHPASSLRS